MFAADMTWLSVHMPCSHLALSILQKETKFTEFLRTLLAEVLRVCSSRNASQIFTLLHEMEQNCNRLILRSVVPKEGCIPNETPTWEGLMVADGKFSN